MKDRLPPMALNLHQFETKATKVIDVVRREGLPTIENMPTTMRSEVGNRMVDAMLQGLAVLRLTGVFVGSPQDFGDFLAGEAVKRDKLKEHVAANGDY